MTSTLVGIRAGIDAALLGYANRRDRRRAARGRPCTGPGRDGGWPGGAHSRRRRPWTPAGRGWEFGVGHRYQPLHRR